MTVEYRRRAEFRPALGRSLEDFATFQAMSVIDHVPRGTISTINREDHQWFGPLGLQYRITTDSDDSLD